MKKQVFGAMAAMAVFFTAPAAAQGFKNFDNLCTGGGFQVCASVHLTTYQTGSTWNIRMEVWNLAGVYGIQYNLHALGLRNGSFTGSYNLTSVTQGATDITAGWKSPGNAVNGAGIKVDASTQTQQGSDGIIGCGPSPSGGGTKWQTCIPEGDPSVVFTFSTGSTQFLLNTAEVRWHATQLPDGSSLKCDSGIPGGDGGSFAPCTVVPEPFTLFLVGSGLAGIGGVGALRRRRKGLDVTDA